MHSALDEFWELAAVQRRFATRKLCMAESVVDPCRSSIIQAHTVPRGQLKHLAREGHVYAGPSIEQMMKSEQMPLLREVGIGKFSALSCFCARHDNALFSDVEDVALVFNPRQLAILHYRAVAAELYKKIGSSQASLHNLANLAERRKDYRRRAELLKAFNKGEQIAIRDGRAELDSCADVLREGAYDRLSALVVRFKRPPSIMTVGSFYPEFDFDGRLLQTLGKSHIEYQAVSFNILVSEGRAAVAIVWRKGCDRGLEFARSYVAQRNDHYTTLAIQTAFEHLENTCVRPEWWEGLKPIEQRTLTFRLLVAGGISHERTSSCLQYAGVTHDDWTSDSYEFFNVDS